MSRRQSNGGWPSLGPAGALACGGGGAPGSPPSLSAASADPQHDDLGVVNCEDDDDVTFGFCSDALLGYSYAQILKQRVHRGELSAGEALGQGSGLGLAIVAEYARILGATLSLEAGEEGRGLRVSLLFQPSVG